MIDLHCHSHFSDGSHSPKALLKKAVDAGIKTLALTDHDTVAGLLSLRQAACETDIQIINGIELSTRWKKHDIHILGLNINPEDAGLSQLIIQQNESRIARAQQIAHLLRDVGVQDAYQKACEVAGHLRVGRPHFAQVLVNEGVVPDIQTAFKRILARGRAAYVATNWLSIEGAVTGIIQAGGQAVMAHPLKYDLTRSKLHALITEFKEAGGCAIEVVSGEMTVLQIKDVAGLCLRFDLLASSGSDYHHESSRIGLGRQRPLPLNCMPVWHDWNH